MKKRIISFITAILTAAFALSFAAFADFSSPDDVQPIIDEITAYELKKNGASSVQDWINGSLTENAGKSSEWYAITLSKSGKYDLSGYADALEKYIAENKITSSTSRMKCALALLAAGRKGNLTDEIAENSVGEQGIMSLIYGLHMLNNGCSCSRYTIDTLTSELLSQQFDDGGWAIMGQNGDIDVTAMTVQALAPQYQSSENVKNAVDRALEFMSQKQQDDGGYISFGTANPESAAQVLIALSSLGTDVTDPRFVKNGSNIIDGIVKYKLSDGSFTHSEGGDSNDTATVQAYLSLTAYMLMKETGTRMYEFSVSETQPENTASAAETTATEAAPVTSQTTQTAKETVSPAPEAKTDYKPIAYCIIAGVTVTAFIVLFVLKKRRMSNFVGVILIAGAAAAFIFFTDFRSSDDYYSSSDLIKENVIGKVTMTIRCDTIVGKDSSPYVPANGIILDTTGFEIESGETVYDILTEAARKYNIQLQANGGYIAGIAYLYEYDYGDLSGWIYHVNGDTPFVMCSDYKLSDGDVIEWLYTCELGNDL
ncbi:MAG: DUF4430 domain-containing protein [Ruminiclostridium sp.]|nr:DUF4430 domain-containing protein [Ruminiclostridium sp.]